MGKEEIKYNKAIEELEKILTRIQNEEIDLDDLTKELKRAKELIIICKNKIEKTEMDIKEVVKGFDSPENP